MAEDSPYERYEFIGRGRMASEQWEQLCRIATRLGGSALLRSDVAVEISDVTATPLSPEAGREPVGPTLNEADFIAHVGSMPDNTHPLSLAGRAYLQLLRLAQKQADSKPETQGLPTLVMRIPMQEVPMKHLMDKSVQNRGIEARSLLELVEAIQKRVDSAPLNSHKKAVYDALLRNFGPGTLAVWRSVATAALKHERTGQS